MDDEFWALIVERYKKRFGCEPPTPDLLNEYLTEKEGESTKKAEAPFRG